MTHHHFAEQMHRDPVNTSAPTPPFDQALDNLYRLAGETVGHLEAKANAVAELYGAGAGDALRRVIIDVADTAGLSRQLLLRARVDAADHVHFLEERIAELDAEVAALTPAEPGAQGTPPAPATRTLRVHWADDAVAQALEDLIRIRDNACAGGALTYRADDGYERIMQARPLEVAIDALRMVTGATEVPAPGR